MIAVAYLVGIAGLVSACDDSPPPEAAQRAIAHCADAVWINANMTMPAMPDWMKPKGGPDLQRVGDAARAAVQKLGQEKVTAAVRTAARARKGAGDAIDVAGEAPIGDSFRLQFSCTVDGDKVTSAKASMVSGS